MYITALHDYPQLARLLSHVMFLNRCRLVVLFDLVKINKYQLQLEVLVERADNDLLSLAIYTN